MKTKLATLVAYLTIALLAGIASTAHATKLYSPPVSLKLGQTLECKILNVSSTARNVSIDIRTDENGLVNDFIIPPAPLPPGEARSFSASAGVCFGNMTCYPSYCVFDVKGRKNNVRASACVRDSSGCKALVEAR